MVGDPRPRDQLLQLVVVLVTLAVAGDFFQRSNQCFWRVYPLEVTVQLLAGVECVPAIERFAV